MPDIRAMILDRVETLLGEVNGVPQRVFRNRGQIKTDDRPCMVLLDGSETVHQSYEGRKGREYAHSSPYVMILRPQIFALLLQRKETEADGYAGELTAYRNAILRAVLQDGELRDLAGPNGDIAYRGSTTDMESGRPMWGELQMDFAFYYKLDPSNL